MAGYRGGVGRLVSVSTDAVMVGYRGGVCCLVLMSIDAVMALKLVSFTGRDEVGYEVEDEDNCLFVWLLF